jgi:hypothetical protein
MRGRIVRPGLDADAFDAGRVGASSRATLPSASAMPRRRCAGCDGQQRQVGGALGVVHDAKCRARRPVWSTQRRHWWSRSWQSRPRCAPAVQLQPSPCFDVLPGHVGDRRRVSGGCQSYSSGRNITPCASGCAFSRTGLVDDVDLPASARRLPRCRRSPRGTTTLSPADTVVALPAASAMMLVALQDLAILLLGVGDVATCRPRSCQTPAKNLPLAVGVVLPDALPGIAVDQLVTRQQVLLDHCARRFEPPHLHLRERHGAQPAGRWIRCEDGG